MIRPSAAASICNVTLDNDVTSCQTSVHVCRQGMLALDSHVSSLPCSMQMRYVGSEGACWLPCIVRLLQHFDKFVLLMLQVMNYDTWWYRAVMDFALMQHFASYIGT